MPEGSEENYCWIFFDTSDPLIRWNVARGVIFPVNKKGPISSPIISFFMRSRLKNVEKYSFEIELEKHRLEKFPEKNARLTSFFAYQTRGEAEYAAEKIDVECWGKVPPTEVLLDNSSTVFKHDQNWITYYFMEERKDYPKNWMDLYWSGQKCSFAKIKPIWELLIDGKGIIIDKEIRQECYDRLENELRCTFLLKLSIYSAACNFDLGVTSFCLLKENNCTLIRPVIKFDEKEAIQTVNRIKESYPDIINCLKPYSSDVPFIVPNFISESFCITHQGVCPNCLKGAIKSV